MKITKKSGIALFLVLAGAVAAIILLHHNPAADASEELLKKVLSCVVILVVCVAFVIGYDKITLLPAELFQNRHLIWKLAKNDFKKRADFI